MAKKEQITITDYISGIEIPATPEETEAVQIFSCQLVEDYGHLLLTFSDRNTVKVRPSEQAPGGHCCVFRFLH